MTLAVSITEIPQFPSSNLLVLTWLSKIVLREEGASHPACIFHVAWQFSLPRKVNNWAFLFNIQSCERLVEMSPHPAPAPWRMSTLVVIGTISSWLSFAEKQGLEAGVAAMWNLGWKRYTQMTLASMLRAKQHHNTNLLVWNISQPQRVAHFFQVISDVTKFLKQQRLVLLKKWIFELFLIYEPVIFNLVPKEQLHVLSNSLPH